MKVQLDTLMQVLHKNDTFLIEGKFQLKYDVIVLNESESLLAHLDEKTMEKNDIDIFNVSTHCSAAAGRCC